MVVVELLVEASVDPVLKKVSNKIYISTCHLHVKVWSAHVCSVTTAVRVYAHTYHNHAHSPSQKLTGLYY